MEEGTVVPLPRPGTTLADDPLLAVLRAGARRMLTHAKAKADLAAGGAAPLYPGFIPGGSDDLRWAAKKSLKL